MYECQSCQHCIKKKCDYMASGMHKSCDVGVQKSMWFIQFVWYDLIICIISPFQNPTFFLWMSIIITRHELLHKL